MKVATQLVQEMIKKVAIFCGVLRVDLCGWCD